MKNSYKPCLALLLVWLLLGCSPQAVPQNVVGIWTHRSGAKMEIREDGSFVAYHLPGGNVFWNSKEIEGFNGYGKWSLGTGDEKGTLLLTFHNDLPGMKPVPGMRAGFATQLFVDKDADGWCFFGWVEEEGGERFIFRKT